MDRHNRWIGGARDIERGKVKGISRVTGNHHLDEILIGVAEVEKRNVESSRELIHRRVGKSEAILWMSGVRIGSRRENGPGSERCASIGGPPETQLARTI